MKRVLIGVLLLVLMGGAAMVVYFRGGDDVVKASGDEYSERIKLELNGVTYSPRDTLTLRIVNNYNESITTGYHFQLYRMENGDWKEVPLNLMFIEVAVTIEPGESWEQQVNLSSLNLEPGNYRIVKKVLINSPEAETPLSTEVWAEFEVTE